MGWVTAWLLIAKLQSSAQQNPVALALQEYGRIPKTIFILRWLQDASFRRRIGAQLNKGEALHALRRFLVVAFQGHVRQSQQEGQLNQVACLNLVTNAIIAWNTVYMQAILDQMAAERRPVEPKDVAHLSPARYEHINPFGHVRFDPSTVPPRGTLRPLRRAR